MSQVKNRHPDPLDGVEDLYIQAILDASPEELRADLVAAGEDPRALIAGVDEIFRRAVADCGRHDDVVSSSAAGTVAAEVSDPFAAHDKAGLKVVARSFGCNQVFLGRLKDRIIHVEDLTSGFLARLAGALGINADGLAGFLAGSARVPATARFKSDTKPEAPAKQSLADAIEGSGLTEDQKRHIRSL